MMIAFFTTHSATMPGEKQPLEPLEAQLAAVIVEHPECVQWLDAGDAALAAEFTPERGQPNPFLHMVVALLLGTAVVRSRPDPPADPNSIAEVRQYLTADQVQGLVEIWPQGMTKTDVIGTGADHGFNLRNDVFRGSANGAFFH